MTETEKRAYAAVCLPTTIVRRDELQAPAWQRWQEAQQQKIATALRIYAADVLDVVAASADVPNSDLWTLLRGKAAHLRAGAPECLRPGGGSGRVRRGG